MNNFVISPFYWYPFVPGYLNFGNVFVGNWVSPWAWNLGVVYNWNDGWNNNFNGGWNNNWDNTNRWNNRRDAELDYALEDIEMAFQRGDQRSLDRLVPQNGRIAIMRDNRYDYSINSQDFYDMLNDLTGSSQTRRYRIAEVRTQRNSARILASHDFTDPWGNRQTVWHTYYLEFERDGYVVREFGSSNRRIW